ncbi:MAG: hypothetical protein IKW39_05495 [Alphaproteobacteria bacterium]|nr:hypothetical protein [Alphaproteobacteria bacterium]
MCKYRKLNFDSSAYNTASGYWKVLSNLECSSNYLTVFPNGLIAQIDDDCLFNVWFPDFTYPVFSKVNFINTKLNGYVLVGFENDETILISPKGNIKAKYVYQKDLYCKARLTKEDGISCYHSGFKIFNKFCFIFDTVALKCQNKCFLAKVNKLDFKELFYVGLYEDIEKMYDNKEGLIFVIYKNGEAKIFDKNFKEIKLAYNIKDITVMSNGDFLAKTDLNTCLFNKKAQLIRILNGAVLENYDRFYVIGSKTYDCMTHKQVIADGVPIWSKGNLEVFWRNESIVVKKTVKGNGFNRMEENVIAYNVASKPTVINDALLCWKNKDKTFVLDPRLSKDEIKFEIFNFVKEQTETSDDDLSIKMFDYLVAYCNHLIENDEKKLSLKKLLLSKLFEI